MGMYNLFRLKLYFWGVSYRHATWIADVVKTLILIGIAVLAMWALREVMR